LYAREPERCLQCDWCLATTMEVADQAVAFGIYQRLVGTALTPAVLGACTFPQTARRLEALAASCYRSTRAAMCPSLGRVFFSATDYHIGCEAVWLWEVCFRNSNDREAVPWRGPESSGERIRAGCTVVVAAAAVVL
jgi:hypothetical protein